MDFLFSLQRMQHGRHCIPFFRGFLMLIFLWTSAQKEKPTFTLIHEAKFPSPQLHPYDQKF